MPQRNSSRRFVLRLVLFTLAAWLLWALGRKDPGGKPGARSAEVGAHARARSRAASASAASPRPSRSPRSSSPARPSRPARRRRGRALEATSPCATERRPRRREKQEPCEARPARNWPPRPLTGEGDPSEEASEPAPEPAPSDEASRRARRADRRARRRDPPREAQPSAAVATTATLARRSGLRAAPKPAPSDERRISRPMRPRRRAGCRPRFPEHAGDDQRRADDEPSAV